MNEGVNATLNGSHVEEHLRYLALTFPGRFQGDGGQYVPPANNLYDLGSPDLGLRTIYLGNDGGNVIVVPDSLAVNGPGGGPTDYTMRLGGGFTGIGTGGGLFTFEMANSVAGGENLLAFDLGAVWFAGGPTISNDFIIFCDNGLDVHRFIAKFGGWTNPEYGWALDRITGVGEAAGKTLFFDNQEPVSDALRSIDFRIAGVNILEIENSQDVNLPLRNLTAPTGVVVNGFMSVTSQDVFGIYNVAEVSPVSANAGMIWAVRPDGAAGVTAATLNANAASLTDYAVLEQSVSGGIARLATWYLLTGTQVTEMRIGEMASAFFGVGSFGALTEINFWFNNAIEMEILVDTLQFYNGAVMTQLDWGTSGELGLQVATVDVERISAGRELISGVEAYPAVTPADLTVDVDDYAPVTGAAQRHVWRLSTDDLGLVNITGIAVQATSDSIFIINVGTVDNIVLQHQNAGSVAANRIISPTGADLTLGPDEYAYLWYDATTARWRILDTNGA